MSTLFQKTLAGLPHDRPPVWFMRQAGRYHGHYQNVRKHHTFLEICRTPSIATEVAMGPINDFDFDAAILFSDILFPIEAMGISLEFNPKPLLSQLLQSPDDINLYRPVVDFTDFMGFQAEATRQTRKVLPADKSLLGFIGGPFTLYIFAVEGTAQKEDFSSSIAGLTDGRFQGFMDHLLPMLGANLRLQANAGADVLAILDSCAGLIPEEIYTAVYLPLLNALVDDIQSTHPETPLLYYGKGLRPSYWSKFPLEKFAAIGIDHRQNLLEMLRHFSCKLAIQGNFTPSHMALPEAAFSIKLHEFLRIKTTLPAEAGRRWICGLGHGIIPQARETNVRTFVKAVKDLRLPQ